MKFKIFSILIMSLLMISCSQIEDLNPNLPEIGNDTRSVVAENDNYFLSSVEQRKSIAQWFAKNYSLQDARRVHNAVTTAHSLGLDEIFFLKEYSSLQPTLNKIVNEAPTEQASLFARSYCDNSAQLSSEATTSATANESSVLPTVMNEYLQIYWPYSKNWDGKTPPVIVYAPDNINSLTGVGYQAIGNGTVMKTIIINEAYCETHPVWIINESETPYSKLPDFNAGSVYSSDGAIYSTSNGFSTNGGFLGKDSLIIDYKKPLMTLRLGKVKSTKNHDSLFAGGSEYEFHFGFLKNTSFSCEADTSNCIQDIGYVRQTFSRDEIKKGTEKELNSVVVSEWPDNLKDVVLKVIETDPGGKEKKFEATLTVTWKGKDYGIDVSIPYSNRDDNIGEKMYTRDFIRSTNNRNPDHSWAWDNSDGVYWTLPYQIGYDDVAPIQ